MAVSSAWRRRTWQSNATSSGSSITTGPRFPKCSSRPPSRAGRNGERRP
jgi:hypothetical protein